jgi:ABC-type multidrug transport system ATPase subunit
MGPSGAGKSTLLDVLSGRQSVSKGELKLRSPGESIKTISSYVEQHDALLGVLTVRETLWYSAKLA